MCWATGQHGEDSTVTCQTSTSIGGVDMSQFMQPPVILMDSSPITQPHRYHPALTPLTSPLHPHCLVQDRLHLWRPSHNCLRSLTNGETIPLSDTDLNCILTVIGHSLASGTRETYGCGLLVFHVFCDVRNIPESQQGPTSSVLLLAFIANCAGLYSGKTLENYFYGVHAWHFLHGLDWCVDHTQISAALTRAAHLAPPASKWPKRDPLTIDIIAKLHSILNLALPLDAAVYACLVTSFFLLAWLGEVTVRSLATFDPSLHVKVSDIRYTQDRHGAKVTVLYLPRTKMSSTGEDIYFAWQQGSLRVDPLSALSNHLQVNSLLPSDALFSWKHKNGHWPLTRSEFLCWLDHTSASIGVTGLKGHGIRIGGTLEYLLQGVPFENVKSMGRWSGDSFISYLHQHAVVMAPYLQDTPALEPFTRYMMPAIH